MNNNDFETIMRRFEWMAKESVPPESYIVLRLDGVKFSKFSNKHFDKPFDIRLSDLMVHSAQVLMKEFGAIYTFTESDEMSLLLPRGFSLYDREVKKLLSVSASRVASAFALALCRAGLAEGIDNLGFDSRVWCSENPERVVDYFRWREADALRCGLNSWAYWTLRQNGKSPGAATSMLHGQSIEVKNELLFEQGINFNDVPAWQKRGVGLYFETYQKESVNQRTGQPVTTTRRRLKVDRSLPMKEEYSELIRQIIQSHS